ncbi:glycosyltransferase family A protein [Flavobacterium sp.]|uniref:glycosyltransferase family 2 protein n=1 Tax=Flavobacterium sp. TaxID=239 RepID=UPI0025FD727D|nr:glycosyltransferase family A protein [Flavobacterium sp.]
MNYNYPINSFKGKSVENAVFSILIPTWNNIDLLKICVESIEKNSYFKHQIIIHVNEGTDGSFEWVKARNYCHTQSDANVGICYSLNALAKLATTDYILYINDDMYVCPNWDKYLMDAIQQQGDDNFYFSGTMIEHSGKGNKCVISPFNFGTSDDNFKEKELLEFLKTTNKKDWFGASWPPSIVHKKLWDKVGGYDVEYSPGFGSDPDFSMKLWNAGVRNFRGIGKSMVYHFQSKSTVKVKKNNYRKTFASKWGVTSSYFYKTMLRLGDDYDGEKLVDKKNIKYIIAKVKAFYLKIK